MRIYAETCAPVLLPGKVEKDGKLQNDGDKQ